MPSVGERTSNWYGKVSKRPPARFTPESPLILMHLYKTAGTSLVNQLEAAVGIRETQGVYAAKERFRERRVKNYRPEGLVTSGKRIYYGHMYYGLHDRLGVEANYGTFLRDPVERAWSHHKHANRALVRGGHSPLSFAEAVQAGNIHLDNLQTRLISGYREVEFGQLNTNHLERAMENLERFVFLGFVEDMDRSISDLNELLGTQMTLNWDLNVAPADAQAQDQFRQAEHELRSHNSLDRQLYDFALELNEAR